jgi:hypothetical protein
VAQHFVTAKFDHFAIDGVIWCIDFIKVRRYLPPSLKAILKKDDAVFFTAEMLERYASNLEDFDARVRAEVEDCVIFFEPPSLDDRIINQAALFSMMSSPEKQLEQWLQAHEQEQPDLFRKIIVPAVLKWEVRDKLDNANITERVVFPGLDGLGAWLRRYYSPNHWIEVERNGQRYLGRIQRVVDMKMGVTLFKGKQPFRDIVLTSREHSQWWELTGDEPLIVRPRPESFDPLPDGNETTGS